ncbi:MAG: tetratricopeptide repeat protein [Deltaproteobacteria bacterium]|nr:tetratricopeptide repeat protein [Deltaproteobacteria bacterium]
MIVQLTLALLLGVAPPPDPFRSLLDQAAADRSAGRLDEALAKLERAYRLKPSPALLNNLGLLFQELGRYREAADAYRGVLDDPTTPENLRQLDRERLLTVEPLLQSGWLVLGREHQGDEVRVCGRRLLPGQENGVPPGVCLLEARRDGVCWLGSWAVVPGLRQELRIELSPPKEGHAHGGVQLTLDSVDELLVDGLVIPTRETRGSLWLLLSPGVHQLFVGPAPGRAQRIEIRAGEIAPLDLRPSPSLSPTPLPPLPSAAAEPAEVASPWPWVLAGTGVALGIGAAVTFTVASDRHSAVFTDARDDSGVITGVTQAEAYERESSARDLDRLALSLAVGAGVVLVASTIWALWD